MTKDTIGCEIATLSILIRICKSNVAWTTAISIFAIASKSSNFDHSTFPTNQHHTESLADSSRSAAENLGYFFR
jgi:hypothetical protein